MSLTAAAPYVPQDDNLVLERLPAATDPQARELERLRRALADAPDDLHAAVTLARRHVELARALGDPRHRGYAQAALRPWWDLTEPPVDVLLLRAVLRQAQHDFDGALADLASVLDQRPGSAQAWLSRAVILQVQGNHQEAVRSCRPLARLTNALLTTTCISGAAALSGEAAESYAALAARLAASGAPPGERLWPLTVLAEIAAALGRTDAAERRFRDALALGIDDHYLRAAYADFLLDHGRAEAVRGLLGDDARSDGFLLRAALADRQLGIAADAKVALLQDRFAASRRRGEAVHLRTEARFTLELLDRPAEALRLALDNWRVQREPWDARLVLAAALASDERDTATPVLEWLERTGLEHVEIERLVRRLDALGR